MEVLEKNLQEEIIGNTTKRVFGLKVKYYREVMRLSQESLAEKLGISVDELQKIESGLFKTISVDILKRIEDVLCIDARKDLLSYPQFEHPEDILKFVPQAIIEYSLKELNLEEKDISKNTIYLVKDLIDKEISYTIERVKLILKSEFLSKNI